MRVKVTRAMVGFAALAAAGGAARGETAVRPGGAAPVAVSTPDVPAVEEEPARNAVCLLAGLGTPVGLVGFEGARHLGRWMEISAGLGIGLGAATTDPNPSLGGSLQWAVMPRLRLFGDRHALTFGTGLSGGNYGGHMGVVDWVGTPPPPITYVVWGNAEVGFESWQGHFAFRAFAGVARGCPAHSACNDKTPAQDPLTIPYTGLGLGASF